MGKSRFCPRCLIPGEGDDGNEFFTIEGDVLKTAAVFDAREQDSYTIRVRAANTKGLWVKRTFTITIEPDPYARWAAELPEGERAPDDDPGSVGIPNLLRYAFGMDPLQPERNKLPLAGLETITEGKAPGRYLTLTYTRRTDDSSLTYATEASDDLVAWIPFAGTEEITDDANDETETVILIDTETISGQPRRFLRVRVER